MGEIADALRRAQAEGAGKPEPRRAGPSSSQAPDVYSQSAKRHEEERAEHAPSRAESAASGSPQASDGSRNSESRGALELDRTAENARVSQGVLVDEGGTVTDACLQLALRTRKALQNRDARTLMVVSAMRNEGKTTVSCNLALALASLGQVDGVALVDLDLRRPSLAKVLNLPLPRCGIEDVIVGGEPLEAARVPIGSPPIDIYPCLRGQAKAHEILLLPAFLHTLEELRGRYEVVVLDSPPTLLVPDATIIMQHVDCFAPVARAGLTRTRNFRKMLDMLPPKSMLGAILDGGALAVNRAYYDHYAPDPVSSETPESVNDRG